MMSLFLKHSGSLRELCDSLRNSQGTPAIAQGFAGITKTHKALTI
jgi:hypothetical protein